ncbi:MAG: M23 family metallopeptidase [Gemmatimonadetes bacterium]|nr:M23 family metallopeptidase [Gemmatimonadota bacterium]
MRGLVLGAACGLLAACNQDAWRGRVRVLTPHEQYAASLRAAGLDSTALGREWLAAGDSALGAPIPLPLPAREVGYFTRAEARAVAYELRLGPGRRLDLAFDQVEGLDTRVFIDLFRLTTDTAAARVHQASARRDSTGRWVLQEEVEDSTTFLLRVQPELLREGRYELVVRAEPILAFPVAGHGNRAVQSFWGMARDGGRRRHEGIDIFAPRGTPVVASVDGMIRSTRPNELGGKVVWLSDPGRGQSLYYAHLDSVAVLEGEGVRRGDTLGFVGNTGNARTTRPHLHFGIYRRGSGAMDPWPWVRLPVSDAAVVAADTARLGAVLASGSPAPTLRRWAANGADTVRTLAVGTPVQVVGAQGSWYRVQLATGEVGYVTPRALGRMVAAGHPRDALLAVAPLAADARATPTP